MSINARVRFVIDTYWDGDIRRAARDCGIPQASLYRLVSGVTENPRAKLVSRLAEQCGASVDWLLTGRGDAPRTTTDRGVPLSFDVLRWSFVLNSLHLSPQTHELMGELPAGPLSFKFALWRFQGGESSDVPAIALPESARGCYGAWADTLSAAIEAHGIAAIREFLEGCRVAIAFGMTPLGAALALDQAEPLARRLAKIVDRYAARLRDSKWSPPTVG
jgi:hypothetical protein